MNDIQKQGEAENPDADGNEALCGPDGIVDDAAFEIALDKGDYGIFPRCIRRHRKKDKTQNQGNKLNNMEGPPVNVLNQDIHANMGADDLAAGKR